MSTFTFLFLNFSLSKQLILSQKYFISDGTELDWHNSNKTNLIDTDEKIIEKLEEKAFDAVYLKMGARISKRGSYKLRKKPKNDKIERHASVICLSKAQIYEDFLEDVNKGKIDTPIYTTGQVQFNFPASSTTEKEPDVNLKTQENEVVFPNKHSIVIQKSSTTTVYYDVSEENDSFYDALGGESTDSEEESTTDKHSSSLTTMQFSNSNHKGDSQVWTIVSLGNENKERNAMTFSVRTRSDPLLAKNNALKRYASDVALNRNRDSEDSDSERSETCVDTKFDFSEFDQILNKHRQTVSFPNHSDKESSKSGYNHQKDDILVTPRKSSTSSDSESSKHLETSEDESDTFEDAYLEVDTELNQEGKSMDKHDPVIQEQPKQRPTSISSFYQKRKSMSLSSLEEVAETDTSDEDVRENTHENDKNYQKRKSSSSSSTVSGEDMRIHTDKHTISLLHSERKFSLDETKKAHVADKDFQWYARKNLNSSSLHYSSDLSKKEDTEITRLQFYLNRRSSSSLSDLPEKEDRYVHAYTDEHPARISLEISVSQPNLLETTHKYKNISSFTKSSSYSSDLSKQEEITTNIYSSFYQKSKSSSSSSNQSEENEASMHSNKNSTSISLLHQEKKESGTLTENEESEPERTKPMNANEYAETTSFFQQRKNSSSSSSNLDEGTDAYVYKSSHSSAITSQEKKSSKLMDTEEADASKQVKYEKTNYLFDQRRKSSSSSSDSSKDAPVYNNINKATHDELKAIIESIDVLEQQINDNKDPDNIPNTYQKLIKIMMQVNQVKNENFDEEILELQNVALNEINRCLKNLKK